MNKKVLIIGAAALVVVLAGGVFFLGPQFLGGGDEVAAEGAESHEEATPGTGIIYHVPERVVNLAPGGDQGFVKVKLALEFDVELEEAGHGGDPAKAFKGEIDKIIPVLEDRINAALNARTSTDLATAGGKEALKQEILGYANELFGEERPVTFVYMIQFVMQ